MHIPKAPVLGRRVAVEVESCPNFAYAWSCTVFACGGVPTMIMAQLVQELFKTMAAWDGHEIVHTWLLATQSWLF